MKVLLSAFECNPNMGSDAYVGWSWAKQISKICETHVLTSENNKAAIEQWKTEHSVNAHIHYISLPHIFKVCLKGRFGYFAGYIIWQWYAYQYAKRIQNKYHFDVVHHVSIADFREIGWLWKLGIPYVFGPVGGGQETPESLQVYTEKYKKQEAGRKFLNRFALRMPHYKKGISHAAKIFVSNDETITLMKKCLGDDVQLTQMCELGVDYEALQKHVGINRKNREIVHILVSGRLIYRKGIEFLLDACQCIQTEVPFVVDIYGGGPQEEDIRKQILIRKLESRIVLHGKVSYEEMSTIYEKSDIFVLPSLRETTGTAVIEAMSNKLPVVALNQNGVKHLVGNQAGILVNIGTKEETVERFGLAMQVLIDNPSKRIQFGNNGYNILISKYTWEKKTQEMAEIYKDILE